MSDDNGNGEGSPRNKDFSLKPSRRTFLGSVAAGIVFGGSGVASANNSTVDVPVGRKRGEKVFRTVPKKWANHVQQVRFVRDRVEEQFKNTAGIAGFSITGNEKNWIGDFKQLDVKFLIDKNRLKKNGNEGKVPDTINNINIQTEGAPDPQPNTCENRIDFDPAPGGVQIDIYNSGELTLCCPARFGPMDESIRGNY
jgi:hypothetical protein